MTAEEREKAMLSTISKGLDLSASEKVIAKRAYEAGRSSMQEEAAQVAGERKAKLKAIRSDLAPELEATRTFVETAEGVLESVAAAIRALKP